MAPLLEIGAHNNKDPSSNKQQLVCAPWPKAAVKSPVGACIFTLYFLMP